MIRLPGALAAWDTPDFGAVLKREVESLPAGALPLQQCVATTSYALDAGCSVMLIAAGADAAAIRARIGVFFSGIVGGCSCADDPTPVEPQPEYAELELVIDRRTGVTHVTPLDA